LSQSILDTPPPKADRRIQYGPEAQHFFDLRKPAGKKLFPLVMNIHGGFWRNKYDLLHAGQFCAALTKAGFTTANVEYRRVGDPGGGWPGTFEDLRNAYGFLHLHASGLDVDKSRLLVMGHSAGGQLALCLAAHEPSVTRVVSLAGALDLQRAYELHLSDYAVVEFLGGTPSEVPEHYKEAAPLNLHISARQAVVSGVKDDVVPVDFTRKYAQAKKAAGENVELIEIADAGHFELIDPATAAFKTVLACVTRMLDS
jgi:acetyl esterase/lipase